MSSSYSGFVQASAQLGLQSILIVPARGIYAPLLPDGKTYLPDIIAQAVVEERHRDELEITHHPVERGAMISDHAFKQPAEVILHLGWSNSPSSAGSLLSASVGAVAAVNPLAQQVANVAELGLAAQSVLTGSSVNQVKAQYDALVQLQATRALFALYTGKRVYTNMVCQLLVTETTEMTEHALLATMTCREIILVDTQVVPFSSQTVKNQTNATRKQKGRINAVVTSSGGAQ